MTENLKDRLLQAYIDRKLLADRIAVLDRQILEITAQLQLLETLNQAPSTDVGRKQAVTEGGKE